MDLPHGAIDCLIDIWRENGTRKELVSEGKSMFPLIIRGDTLNIKFTQPQKVKAGDIAVFRRGPATVAHRLLKKHGSGYIEKGDFHVRAGFARADSIIGIVELQPYFLNRIMAFLGFLIYKLGIIAKPLLILPFIINAGTRIYTKLYQPRPRPGSERV